MKKENRKRLVKAFISLAVILAITATSAVLFAAQCNQKDPKILPPNSKPLGLSYAEWSVKWWQWIYSIPPSDNPWFQDEKCDVGEQPHHVRFLAGKICMTVDPDVGCYGDYVDVTRQCTIRHGTYLFFPVANAEADNVGIEPPFTKKYLSAWVTQMYGYTESMSAEVDGVPVKGLSNPLTSPYRVKSHFFSYDVPEDNVYDIFFGQDFAAQTIKPAIADGAFLMLAPLPVGEHTVRFGAKFVYPDYSTFSFSITYLITVTP